MLMDIRYNSKALMDLINDFYELTGVWVNVHAASGEDIQIRDYISPFCSLVQCSPDGLRQCRECDALAAETCQKIRNVYHYRCHAGICETLIPLVESGKIIAYLGFGQLLDETDLSAQWDNSKRLLKWYSGDEELLREAFFKLPQMSQKKMQAFADILKNLSVYLQSESIVQTMQSTDMQRLDQYLRAHYLEPVSMKQVTSALLFGTTKVSKLCKELSNGHTMTWILGSYRVANAKKLLETTDKSITEISSLSGYDDFNYFTKVFKKYAGMTPSDYRKVKKRSRATEAVNLNWT